jgi:thiol-disulfide isomerase/thioredoxin
MKKIFLVTTIAFFSISAFAQTNFTFSGKIEDGNGAYARLTYLNDQGKWTTDSCALQNGTFTFKGNINGGCMATFIVYKTPFQARNITEPNATQVFLEQGNIMAQGSYKRLKDLKVTGSKSNDEYNELHLHLHEMNKELEPVSNNFNRISKELNAAKKQNKGDKIIDSLNNELTVAHKQIEPFSARYEAIVHQFVITHPNSFVTPLEMSIYVSSWPLDSVKLIFNKLSPAVQNTFAGKGIKKQIADIMDNSAHTIAKNFTTVDVNGKRLSLADFKGRYVLLDFWGSWCVPCREGMPHLIQAFNKYHKAGFEVIAVAADDNTQADWKRAIKKDKTGIWNNILSGGHSEGGANPSSITGKFSVSVFPTKILIDKTGMIVGRYDEMETAALDKKLAEIFGAN